MSRTRRNYKKEEKPCGNKGGTKQPSLVFKTATDPNFMRKESGKWNVPSLLQSSDMMNRADISLILAPTIPQDRFNSFMIEVARFYQSIRRNNSANAAYTMADVAAYILNVRSIRAILTQLTRTIRCGNNTDKMDTGIPYLMIGQSMGLSSTNANLVLEVMDNSARLHDAIYKVNKLVETGLPVGDFSAFEMDDWLLSTMWRDALSPKHSIICAAVSRALVVQYTASANVVSSSEAAFYSGGATGLFDLITAISGIVSGLTTNYTNALIAGDIQHAMAARSYHPISGSDKITLPIDVVYDEKTLRMVKNSIPLWSGAATPTVVSTASFVTGAVSNTVKLASGLNNVNNHSLAVADQMYIDADPAHCSMGDIAMLTYLQVHGELSSNDVILSNTAGWVVMDLRTMYCNASVATTIEVSLMAAFINNAASSIQSTAMEGLQNACALWSMVDWMPMLLFQYSSRYQWLWDIEFFARITAENLDTYQSILITSLYDTAANAIR